jgi:hypothetical protein
MYSAKLPVCQNAMGELGVNQRSIGVSMLDDSPKPYATA